MMVRELVRSVSGSSLDAAELRDAIFETGDSGTINHRKFGRWLSRNAGPIVDGLKLVKAKVNRNAEAWRVVSVSSVVSVPADVHIEDGSDPMTDTVEPVKPLTVCRDHAVAAHGSSPSNQPCAVCARQGDHVGASIAMSAAARVSCHTKRASGSGHAQSAGRPDANFAHG